MCSTGNGKTGGGALHRPETSAPRRRGRIGETMEDDNDGFKFSKGFVFEDSDDEKQAPAQPAWAFPDSKREMERELKAAGVTSVDAKIQKARANAKGGGKKGKGKKDDSDISDDDDSDDDSDVIFVPNANESTPKTEKGGDEELS